MPRRAAPDIAAKVRHHAMRSSGSDQVRVLSRDNSDSALGEGEFRQVASLATSSQFVETAYFPEPAVGWQLRSTGPEEAASRC